MINYHQDYWRKIPHVHSIFKYKWQLKEMLSFVNKLLSSCTTVLRCIWRMFTLDIRDLGNGSFYCWYWKLQNHPSVPNHVDAAKSYNNLGNVYCYLGDFKKALEYYRRL